jgi:hypothetical protein
MRYFVLYICIEILRPGSYQALWLPSLLEFS